MHGLSTDEKVRLVGLDQVMVLGLFVLLLCQVALNSRSLVIEQSRLSGSQMGGEGLSSKVRSFDTLLEVVLRKRTSACEGSGLFVIARSCRVTSARFGRCLAAYLDL